MLDGIGVLPLHLDFGIVAILIAAVAAALPAARARSATGTRPTADEIAAAEQWCAEHFGAGETPATNPPFSFCLDGRDAMGQLRHWPTSVAVVALDAQRTQRTQTWTDPPAGLLVRCVQVQYHDYPAVEWTLYLKNGGTQDTPIVADVLPLDLHVPVGTTEVLLHHNVGSPYQVNDYQPLQTPLPPGASQHFAGEEGRPTSSDLSFFNLEAGGQGMLLALGWPGQWSCEFSRETAGSLRLRAGQELTHFVLHPGEEIRTPLVALQFWQGGDWLRAQNTWRRWFIAHNIPRPGGDLPPTQWCGSSGICTQMMAHATEANQKAHVDAYLQRGWQPDFWWMDAGWYPCDGDWWRTGTWEADPVRFPHGLRPVTDYLHAHGVRAILWFEPERVRAGTWLAVEHPEWVLPAEGDDGLLNFGDPEAWRWVVDHVDRLLTDYGVDIYRQDLNFSPLAHWRRHDAPDRQGITENRYVTWLLAYWDELLRRHPGLLYDNCAGGGRRNDLESMRRGVPYTKSDYAEDPVGVQGETFGISLWLPYFAASWSNSDDPYRTRSRLAHVVGVSLDPRLAGHLQDLPQRLEEWRLVAPCYWGDFWPLTPHSVDSTAWIAWQFDLPDAGEGIVQAFRRADCPAEALRVRLRGLAPEVRYAVRDLDAPEVRVLTGECLMTEGIELASPTRPAALIVHYRRAE